MVAGWVVVVREEAGWAAAVRVVAGSAAAGLEVVVREEVERAVVERVEAGWVVVEKEEAVWVVVERVVKGREAVGWVEAGWVAAAREAKEREEVGLAVAVRVGEVSQEEVAQSSHLRGVGAEERVAAMVAAAGTGSLGEVGAGVATRQEEVGLSLPLQSAAGAAAEDAVACRKRGHQQTLIMHLEHVATWARHRHVGGCCGVRARRAGAAPGATLTVAPLAPLAQPCRVSTLRQPGAAGCMHSAAGMEKRSTRMTEAGIHALHARSCGANEAVPQRNSLCSWDSARFQQYTLARVPVTAPASIRSQLLLLHHGTGAAQGAGRRRQASQAVARCGMQHTKGSAVPQEHRQACRPARPLCGWPVGKGAGQRRDAARDLSARVPLPTWLWRMARHPAGCRCRPAAGVRPAGQGGRS